MKGFTRPLRTLLIASALGLLHFPAAGATVTPGGESRSGATQESSAGDVGGGRSPLKFFRTVRTTWQVWVPFFGWVVVCESSRVECNKGGTNCPIGPQA